MKVKTPKYRVLCHILVFFVCLSGLAAQKLQKDSIQTTQRLFENSFSVELLGSSMLLSVNYERFLTENFSLRIGLGPFPIAFSIPISLNTYLFTNNGHSMEIGGGYVLAWFSSRGIDARPYAVARIGYNYQDRHGFLFKATFTPTFSYPSSSLFTLPLTISIPPYCCEQLHIGMWFGISFGTSF